MMIDRLAVISNTFLRSIYYSCCCFAYAPLTKNHSDMIDRYRNLPTDNYNTHTVFVRNTGDYHHEYGVNDVSFLHRIT